MSTPERIWLLLHEGDEGEHVWCNDPDPTGKGELKSVEYVRADAHQVALATAHTRGAEWGLEAAARECERYAEIADWAIGTASELARTIYGRDARAARALATAIRALPIQKAPGGEGK